MIRAVKGTRDLLPPATAVWNHVEAAARELFRTYNYQEIRTPILEETQLFTRSVGEETDIVMKEMYSFVDRDGSSLTLRPECTASVIRAYIEHRMDQWPGLKKLYYIGPMFRRERPQKGRYRQFSQIGAECIGSESPLVDAEMIELSLEILARCGIEGARLLLNSVGCPACRPAFVAELRSRLAAVKHQLCADCQRRSETNPLRVLDSKLASEQAVIETLPRITDHLCAACREHYTQLQEQLRLRDIPFAENWRLVRGLDYYTRTTFEVTAPGLGAQNAVCGGGRYDGLVELLGGPSVKGIGFAVGTDRLVLALSPKTAAARVDLYIAWIGATYPAAVRLAQQLREKGLRVELPHIEQKLGRSLELAAKLGVRSAVIVGEEELASGQLTVRDLSTGAQKRVAEADLVQHVQAAVPG
ncbi:MAG: histidine--tRNA ligase [Acidobacteriia bacterium]|nr:histidine--tRNA ligase [Terriglobia bacterium]